jgi:3-oxoacyl-[acyl-carrier-protein] synthase-3
MYAAAEKLADGSLRGWLKVPVEERATRSIFTIQQDVRLLNENVIEQTLGKPLEKVMTTRGLRPQDVDWFVPHMSSEYFRKQIIERMEIVGFPVPQEKWFTNLHEKGNTGSASIYIMLEELLHGGRLSDGQRILCYVPESGRFTGSLIYLTAVAHA